MEEEWRDIEGYAGYQVSTLGRVRTHNKTSTSARFKLRKWKDRILKQKYYGKTPSARVELWNESGHRTFLVHRLVMSTFMPIPNMEEMTVNHKDGDRRNNKLNNLEWMDLRSNIQDGFAQGFFPTRRCRLFSAEFGLMDFQSFAEADRYLKRSSGYVSLLVNRGRYMCSSNDGKEYYVFDTSERRAEKPWRERML